MNYLHTMLYSFFLGFSGSKWRINILIALAFFSLNPNREVCAQGASPKGSQNYNGKRIALYQVGVLGSDGKSVEISCHVVNTGRTKIAFPRDAENTLIEWDKVGMPAILDGHEISLIEALSALRFDLDPDEFLKNQSVRVFPKTVNENTEANACGDLSFDTAYLIEYTPEYMRVRYQFSNKGNISVNLFANATSNAPKPAINTYFVSGTRITRGAFQAGSSTVDKGRETLDAWVRPGQKIRGELKLSLENRTKFAPNIVLELDPLLISNDCKRTNNNYAIMVDF